MAFRKSKQKPNQESEETFCEQPKYPNPKILLIDVNSDAETTLIAEGYSVCTGSFGKPYQVEKGDGFNPVIVNGSLPVNFAEQEIIVIDLVPTDILDEVQGEKHTSPGKNDWWASCSDGVINPSPRLMANCQDDFDRILSHGGVFIIFAHPRYSQELIWGHIDRYQRGLTTEKEISYDNWSFLSILENLEAKHDRGSEIAVASNFIEHPIGHCLLEHTNKALFFCTLNPMWELEKRWITLATNKYRETVAGIVFPEKEETAEKMPGWVFILPQLDDKPGFLAQMFKEVLPDLVPQLFPHVEGSRWVQRPEYELPKVLELEHQMHLVREKAKQEVTSLEKTIEEERDKMGYLHNLLRETGRPLVIAVKEALETLGFQSVVDVDEESEKSGDAGPKREDLQIHDLSPILLVEVKGISGLPTDAAALQVWKYLAPRMREWERTDIRGLSIVNHQRHLPALERENQLPFRDDIITNAEEHKFALLTTWDLFRLIRSYFKNNWKPEHIKPLFYQNGRIEPVPTHYELVGIVEHFWPKAGAIGVRIKKVSLEQGDRMAFELPVEFEEQIVSSLQVDKKPVEQVDIGQLAGIETHLTKEQAKKGIRVFRVRE